MATNKEICMFQLCSHGTYKFTERRANQGYRINASAHLAKSQWVLKSSGFPFHWRQLIEEAKDCLRNLTQIEFKRMACMVSTTFKSTTTSSYITYGSSRTDFKQKGTERGIKQRISSPHWGTYEREQSIIFVRSTSSITNETAKPRLSGYTNRSTNWHSAASISGHDFFIGLHLRLDNFQHTQRAIKWDHRNWFDQFNFSIRPWIKEFFDAITVVFSSWSHSWSCPTTRPNYKELYGRLEYSSKREEHEELRWHPGRRWLNQGGVYRIPCQNAGT